MLPLWETMMSIRNLAKETDCIGEIILALGGRESTNPDKTFSTPADNPAPQDGTRPVPSLLGVEGARGSGDAAPGVSESPAKTPRLDFGLLKKHPHPLLAGNRTPMRANSRTRDGTRSPKARVRRGVRQPRRPLLSSRKLRCSRTPCLAGEITAVKADLVWPTLTDDRSDTRDVSQFYEEFEDVCALANSCKGRTGPDVNFTIINRVPIIKFRRTMRFHQYYKQY